jgi:histidyl-tRNA synthetase
VKLKKQISYADAKKIPYIIIAGEDEINNNSVTIKIMSSGEQKKISLNELSLFVKEEFIS